MELTEEVLAEEALPSVKNSANDMTKGKPYKVIWLFAYPLIIGNILQQMYNMVDSIVIGNSSGGSVGLTALAASGNIIFLFNSFFIGFSLGTTIVVAQFVGARKQEDLQKTVDTIYRTLFILSIPITIAGVVLARPLLVLLDTPSYAVDSACLYMQICFLGMFALYGFNINNGIMQGLGDSKSPLLFLAVGMVLNIILDLLFVFTFGWGVAGAAIATVIAQAAAFIFSTIYINRKKNGVKIHIFKNKYDKEIMRRIVHLGLPAGLQNALFTLGLLVLQRLINDQEVAHPGFVAGYGVGNKIDQLTVMLEASFANALTAFVGQNYGAKNLQRIKQGVRQTIVMSGAIVLVITGLIMIFSRPILSLFIEAGDPDFAGIITAGQAFIYGVMPFYVVLNLLYLVNAALRGVNRSIIPMFGSFMSIVVRLIAAYWITAQFGAVYMFISYGLGWCFSVSLNSSLYIFGRWRKEFDKIEVRN